MSEDISSIVTGVYDGAAYWGDPGAPVTGLDQDLTNLGYHDLGYFQEDGPSLTLPGEAESHPVRVWQRARVVRTIRIPNDEVPTWNINLVQNDIATIELALGTQVTVDANGDRSYTIDGNVVRRHGRLVLDVIAGTLLRRYYAPNAIVTTVGEQTFTNDGTPLGFPTTIACDFSPEINGQIRVFERPLNLVSAQALGGLHTTAVPKVEAIVPEENHADVVYREVTEPDTVDAALGLTTKKRN